jgi:glycosyltransferase involved in cell wall biosynthesis
MNILMLGRWLPPPRRPVKSTREYQFARQLAGKHHVTLAFVSDNPDAVGAISALRAEFGDLEFASVPKTWKSLTSAVSLAAGESCTLSYFRSEALRTRIADRLRRTRYDLVFVSASSMIQYALDSDPSLPMLVDFGRVDSEWWARQAVRGAFPARRFFRAEAARLRIAEASAARRAVRCVVETHEAGRVVGAWAPTASIAVIPNGVDVEFFGSSPRGGRTPLVVINSALDTEAGIREVVDFCRTILPVVRAGVPEARIAVVSKEAVRVNGAFTGCPGVEVSAPVTDVRALFHTHAVAAAPMREGSELRSSVLEPMAAGVPVVTTRGAAGQLRAVAGRDILTADDPVDFARQMVRLLRDPSARAAMGARGRAYVATHHAWNVVAGALMEIVEGLALLPTPTPVGQGETTTGSTLP